MRAMKDSGVEWIGDIPQDWEVVTLKKCCDLCKGLLITKAELIENGSPVISYGQIHSKTNKWSRISEDLIRYVDDSYKFSNPLAIAQEGNIIFADTSEDYEGIGNCIYVDLPQGIFAGYHTVIVKPFDFEHPKYLAFLFQTDCWRSQLRSIASGIKVFSVTQKMLKNTTLLIPTVDVQRRIATYLDSKCSKIDAIIEKQQAVIEKLKEYKLSVITETVTKGLNLGVAMKDSGVEWIGEVPKHWDVVKIKYLVSKIGDVDHYMPNTVSVGIPYVSTGDLSDKFSLIDFEKCKQISYNDYVALSNKIKITLGDIIFARYATIGTVCFVDTDRDAIVSYSCVIIKVDNKVVNSKFLYYAMKSSFFIEGAQRITNSNTQGNIGIEALGKVQIVVPNLVEQKEIMGYLDRKCLEIDSVIKRKQMMLGKLEEYKKSLIYEVVTGKKEV